MIITENRIGYSLTAEGNVTFTSFNPTTGEELPHKFAIATENEIEATMALAANAFSIYVLKSGKEKAAFLKAIANEILSLGDELIQTAVAESGLPEARITGERGRTIGQITMFADLLTEGSWVEASVDTALPDRTPAPKPDIRCMLRPVGPVVVFSASNFPLAFSTAGGDTISALAAGNPVVVKAHPSHPATNALVAEAILKAAKSTQMPDGVFSTLYSNKFELGLALVKHPVTKSVAFTGSYNGGMALFKVAQERSEPIPVFAEMGSVNPVFLLPAKLEKDAAGVAKILATSVTMGAGQFCTNPGLMAGIKGEALNRFISKISEEISTVAGQTMLNKGIWENYHAKRAHILAEKGITLVSGNTENTSEYKALPAIATVSFSDFSKNPTLHEEIFGPFSLLVVCNNSEELLLFAALMQGQLTISLFADATDSVLVQKLLPVAEQKAGRVILNGAPTGVEVCSSMQHGGPFPASTDGRFTSVGTNAIRRFVRPIAYQNIPDNFLPLELQSANPLGIWRKVNGKLTTDSI